MGRCRTFRGGTVATAMAAAGLLIASGCAPKPQTPIGPPAARLEASSTYGSLLQPTPAPANTPASESTPATTTGPTTDAMIEATTGPATEPGVNQGIDGRTVIGRVVDAGATHRRAIDRRTVGLDITWAVVDRVPADVLDPLDARALLTSAPLAGGAVLTTGRQTALALFGDGAAADDLLQRVIARTDGPAAEAGHQFGIAAPGTTTTFRFTTGAGERSVGLSIYLSTLAASPTTAPAPTNAVSTPLPAALTPATTSLAPSPSTAPASTEPITSTEPASTEPATAPTAPPTPPAATVPTTSAAVTMTATATAITVPTEPPSLGAITITLQGFVDTSAETRAETRAAAEGGPTPATRPAATTTPETAYLPDLPLSPGSRYALALPCRFGNTRWRGLIAFIDVTAAPADAAAVLDQQFRRPPATGPTAPPAAMLTLRRAVDALRGNEARHGTTDPRPPLLFLATATRANIAADAILVAGRPMLDQLREKALQFDTDSDVSTAVADTAASTAANTGASISALSWALDKSAVLAMCADAAQGKLAPELAAVLVLHAGEVGRHADAMAEAVNGVGNAADLQNRLVGENTIALEDNSPAARVRAFDWLKGQGRAPDGYDPLGDVKSRRDAINRAIAAPQGTR